MQRSEREKRPWLTVYGGRIPEEPIPGSLTGFLEDAAAKYPKNVALTEGERRVSYSELLELTERFAAGLVERGIERGDRVALMLPNCVEYVVGFFGILRAGAIVTQVNPAYVGRELSHLFENSGSRIVIAHASAYEKIKGIQSGLRVERVVVVGGAPEGGLRDGDARFEVVLESEAEVPGVAIDPERDVASIQYTGGTTGISKGAMLTHRNLLGGIRQTMDLLIEDPEDFPRNGKVIALAPFFHIFGMTMVLLFGLRMGWNLIAVARFDPGAVMEMIRDEEPVMVPGVATIFIALHNYPQMQEYGLEKVRLFTSGGASVPLGLLRSFERRTGRPIWEGYGLSEGAPATFNTYLRGSVGGSIGVPIPGSDARIVEFEDDEREVEPGEPGELLIRGPQVMQGYWNMPEETESALRGGWLHTGDIVRLDDVGYLYVVDRKKEVINASGFKVYPREVEEVLYEHEEVVEAVAIGVPDDYRGETVKAFVVKKASSGLTEEEVVAHCRENLTPYKVPTLVEFRDELPKSGVGKLLKRVLADEERAKAGLSERAGKGVSEE